MAYENALTYYFSTTLSKDRETRVWMVTFLDGNGLACDVVSVERRRDGEIEVSFRVQGEQERERC